MVRSTVRSLASSTSLTLLLAGCYAGTTGNPGDELDPDGIDDGADGGADGGQGEDDDDDDDVPPRADTGDAFGRAQLRRLTRAQWARSVTELLGPHVIVPADLDPDLVEAMFSSVGASTVATSQLGVERYETAALDVAAQTFANEEARTALVGCTPSEIADPCVEEFVHGFLRRAWRRPATQPEIDRWLAVADESAELHGTAWNGLQFAVAGILQSPNFLYVVELGEVDPDDAKRRRYSDFEMAARLGLFLWGSTPDEALLDAAAAGELTTPSGLENQARRLLADPRARAATVDFVSEYMHVDALDNLAKDPTLFPEFTGSLKAAMRGELERMVEHVVFEQEAPLLDLLTTSRTYVDSELAALYGMPEPDPALTDEEGFAPFDIPAEWDRSGLLGTGAFLASNARVTRTSPTLRGLFLQKRLLCFEVPPPPDDVDAELPEIEDTGMPMTMRERLSEHATNPTCAACHDLVDPLGLAAEKFDGIGRHRPTDQGLELDVTGELDGVAFDGLEALAQTVSDHPNVARCVARNVYRHAIGHLETSAENPLISALGESFTDEGGTLTELMISIVTSDGFRFLGPA